MPSRIRPSSILRLCVCLHAAVVTAEGGDWSHWRGDTRDDVSKEDSGFGSGAWPPPEAWSASVGLGSSSPLVVAGKVYAIGHAGGQDSVVCLDAASGSELWRQSYPSPEYGRQSIGDKNSNCAGAAVSTANPAPASPPPTGASSSGPMTATSRW